MFSEDPKQDKATHLWAMVVTLAILLWFGWSFWSTDLGQQAAFALSQGSGLILGLGATACFGLPLLVYRFKSLRYATFAIVGIGTIFASARMTEPLAPYLLALHPQGDTLVACGTAKGSGRHGNTAPDMIVARSTEICEVIQASMNAGLSGDAAVAEVNNARP